MSLHILQCRPDPYALASWASRNGLVSPDGDYGYAFHALLSAAFGAGAPKPFRYLGGRQGLLAYTTQDLAELREHAALATPDVANALGLGDIAARAFPTAWRVGQHLSFEVRVRPVVRAKDGRERDAFLHSLDSAAAPPEQAPTGQEHGGPVRAKVYSDWLKKQLSVDHAAELIHADLHGFRLTRVLRRSSEATGGKRKARAICGPDVLFKGELGVTDSQTFAQLVARGAGRHRAFGFGMLLLKPTC
jgi:CRISPR system Cascade subunit CasE